jgi:hypothetical protein
LAIVNIKTKKLCLLTQFSGKVLGQIASHQQSICFKPEINYFCNFTTKNLNLLSQSRREVSAANIP